MSSHYSCSICNPNTHQPTFRSFQANEYTSLLARLNEASARNQSLRKQVQDLDQMYHSAVQDLYWHADMLASVEDKMATMKTSGRRDEGTRSSGGERLSSVPVIQDRVVTLQREVRDATAVLRNSESRLEKLKELHSARAGMVAIPATVRPGSPAGLQRAVPLTNFGNARHSRNMNVGYGDWAPGRYEELWVNVSVPDEGKDAVENEENSEDKMKEETQEQKEDEKKRKAPEKLLALLQAHFETKYDDKDFCISYVPRYNRDHDAASTTATLASLKSRSPCPSPKFESARATPEGKVKTRDFASGATQPRSQPAHPPFPDGLPCECPSCVPIELKSASESKSEPKTKGITENEFKDVSVGGDFRSVSPCLDDWDYCDCYEGDECGLREDSENEVEHDEEAHEPWARQAFR